MCDRNGGRRLRQWLIEQIDSSLYPGLIWENDNKSMFRIPWKHAGKQDYNQEVDASIFKAWALFKGKFKEGDKAEPATWKTRLRCALNKSPDFEEVGERSQLDISEPYKVYRIVPEEEQKSKNAQMCGSSSSGSLGEVTDMDCSQSECEEMVKEPAMDEYLTLIKRSPSPLQENCLIQPLHEWWPPQLNPGLQSLDVSSLYNSVHQGFSLMAISFYYVGKLVGYTTTSQPNGCRISLNYPLMSNDKPYTPEGMENIRFPSEDTIQNERQKQVTRKLFGHLERGVLLLCNRQGIFIKRLCQGRVFWSSNSSLNKDRPTKLDRDEVVKIFDTNQFIRELQTYYSCQGRYPESRVTLCFGEEFPDSTPLRFKLIIVQIEQVALRQLTQEAEKGCGTVGIHAPQEAHHEQMTHIVQDICGTHQRSIFRENQQITV